MRLIVAMDEKGGIGKNFSLLAYLPTDLKFFRRMTLGKTVIMGHGTLVSLPGGRPLPGRRNIVLSRTLKDGTGYEVARSLSELADLIRDTPKDNVLVIGGAQIYEKLIPYCDYAYVTEIKGDLGADTFITPMRDRPEWVTLHEPIEFHENGHIFSFRLYGNRNVRRLV